MAVTSPDLTETFNNPWVSVLNSFNPDLSMGLKEDGQKRDHQEYDQCQRMVRGIIRREMGDFIEALYNGNIQINESSNGEGEGKKNIIWREIGPGQNVEFDFYNPDKDFFYNQSRPVILDLEGIEGPKIMVLLRALVDPSFILEQFYDETTGDINLHKMIRDLTKDPRVKTSVGSSINELILPARINGVYLAVSSFGNVSFLFTEEGFNDLRNLINQLKEGGLGLDDILNIFFPEEDKSAKEEGLDRALPKDVLREEMSEREKMEFFLEIILNKDYGFIRELREQGKDGRIEAEDFISALKLAIKDVITGDARRRFLDQERDFNVIFQRTFRYRPERIHDFLTFLSKRGVLAESLVSYVIDSSNPRDVFLKVMNLINDNLGDQQRRQLLEEQGLEIVRDYVGLKTNIPGVKIKILTATADLILLFEEEAIGLLEEITEREREELKRSLQGTAEKFSQELLERFSQ